MDTVIAAIDIGTNSTKMTVARASAGVTLETLFERSEITRLGKGVDATRSLSDEAIRATLDAVARFAAEARGSGATKIVAVGTSALRDASNGQAFLDGAEREAGVTVEVITGDREAQLAFAAVQSDPVCSADKGKSILVFDIGGGSTELIVGDAAGLRSRVSLDLGAVRATERFIRTDPPDDADMAVVELFARETLAAFVVPPNVGRLVGIGGTAVNVGAMVAAPNPDFNGLNVSDEYVHRMYRHMRRLPLADRRNIPGLEPARADVIVAGVAILNELLAYTRIPVFTVCVRGLRYGLIAEASRGL